MEAWNLTIACRVSLTIRTGRGSAKAGTPPARPITAARLGVPRLSDMLDLPWPDPGVPRRVRHSRIPAIPELGITLPAGKALNLDGVLLLRQGACFPYGELE